MPEGTAEPVRIMLVEDQAAFRGAMVALLSREPDLEVVAEAGTLAEARRHAASVGFDVAIVDLGLPDGDGLNLIGELRETRPGASTLVLSASLDPAVLARAEEAGAEGVLDKMATPGEVADRIRRVGGG